MLRNHASVHRPAHLPRLSWRVITTTTIIASGLTACGGGDGTPSKSQPDSRQAGADAPLSAQFVPVVSSLVNDTGWVAAPPIVVGSTTPSTPLSNGRVFYVETLWGSTNQSTTGRDGTSKEKAWLSLRDFAKFQFQANDTVLLRCGSVWRDQLTFKAVGTGTPTTDADFETKYGIYVNPSLSNGVKIGVYDTPTQSCADTNLPVIRASDSTSSLAWSSTTVEGRAILEAPKDDATVVRLFRWSTPETAARYPNETATQRYAYAVAVEKDGSETDTAWNNRRYKQFKVTEAVRQELQGREIEGATVYIRTTPFQIQRRTVSAYDSATGLVTLNNVLGKPTAPIAPIQAATGIGYFLQGKKWMIDQPGEWTQADGKLYYYPRESTPAGLEMTQSTANGSRSYGIKLVGINNLTIERLSFEHQEYASILLEGSSNVTISGVHSVYAREIGIAVTRSNSAISDNVVVTKSRVMGAGGYGILTNRENSPGKVKFNENYVSEIGTTVSSYSFEAGIGIRVGGSNSEAKNNYVINTGAAGVWFSGDAPGLVVEGNTVFKACKRLADCGGIYTFPDVTQAAATSLPKPTAAETPKYLRNNLVVGVLGDMEGLATGSLSITNVPGRFLAHAIYLDSHSRNIEISGNETAGTQVGIFLHNAAWNYVHDNKVKSASQASLLVSDDSTLQAGTKGLIRGNRFVNNTLFSHRRVDPAAFASGTQDIGSIRGNVDQIYAQLWVHPTDPKLLFEDSTAGDRNVSEGNTTLTLSKVESPAIWRVISANKIAQASGGIWAIKAGTANHVELSMSQWLSLIAPNAGSSLDGESSPVSYRPYATTLGGGGSSLVADFLLPQSPQTWFPNFTNLPGERTFSVQAGLSECGAAPSCGVLMGSEDWHIVASKPFALTQNTIYLVKYNIAAGGAGAWSDALVRPDAAPWTAVASIQPFQLAANEKRRIEHFFRAPANASNMVLSLRPSDRTKATTGKAVYLNTASVHAVDSVQVLGKLESFSVTLANTSQGAKNFSCQDAGLSDCSNVRDENNQSVTFPVSVNARTMKRFYINSPTWSN